MILAQDIRKAYGRGDKRVMAIDGVSLQVGPGEFVVVRGPSGCGKTTLLLTLGGLLAPDDGTVQLDGRDPYNMPATDRDAFRAANVGFVFQQFYLVGYLNVRDNVLAPLVAGQVENSLSRGEDLIRQFNLEDRQNHYPAELSTGEKQRVAMARAMLKSPGCMLADEPTGNLDEQNARIVVDALKHYARTGAAVIMVTHDPRWEDDSDRIIRLEYGRVISPPDETERGDSH